MELDERLASGARGGLPALALLGSGSAAGYESLGWEAGGVIRQGALADLVCLRLDGVRLAGTPPADLLEAAVFAAAAADVRDVLVDGRFVVRDGEHVSLDVGYELRSALKALPG
jgi:cytosine/adenosine deaminase-related metal-dependent hydrolase